MLTCTALMLLWGLALQDPPRRPVPDRAELKEAETIVRDLFKEEYAKKASADRVALARKLLEQAAQTEGATKFVLLREARDLAAAGDQALALRAADLLVRAFEIEATEAKSSALTAAAAAARTSEEVAAIARAYLKLAEEAAGQEDFAGALKALDAAATQAKRAKETPLVTRASARKRDVAQLQERSRAIQKARETLEKMPDDPAANLAVGQYECFVRGRWEAGLPFLAKAAGSPAGGIAAQDLAAPPDAGAKVAVADGYYQLSEKESGVTRENLRARALHWYESAYEGLTGLNKVRIEKRIPELRMERFKGTWVEVSDPKSFDQPWRAGEALELASSPTGVPKVARLVKPPPGDHDGISVRIRFKSDEFPTGAILYEDRKRCAFIDRKYGNFRMATFESGGWVNGGTYVSLAVRESYVLTIVIEDGEYVFHVDGEEVAREATDFGRLISLSLQSDRGSTQFDQIRLRRRE